MKSVSNTLNIKIFVICIIAGLQMGKGCFCAKARCFISMTSSTKCVNNTDSNVHGANMGPIWGRQDPGGPHAGPMNFAIWEGIHSTTFLAIFRFKAAILYIHMKRLSFWQCLVLLVMTKQCLWWGFHFIALLCVYVLQRKPLGEAMLFTLCTKMWLDSAMIEFAFCL